MIISFSKSKKINYTVSYFSRHHCCGETFFIKFSTTLLLNEGWNIDSNIVNKDYKV